MAHKPHVYVPQPWPEELIPLSVAQLDHLTKVLRIRGAGTSVTYTDGSGTIGGGTLRQGGLLRDHETTTPRPRRLVLAVAPPKSRDRQRFLVEKLAELGVAKLSWLKTRFGQGKPPSDARASAWVISALEQSRGSWLMEVGSGMVAWEELESPIVVCTPEGAAEPTEALTVVVGPEGGWARDEVADSVSRWSLGPRVLRVETAAIVAAARML